MTLYITPDNKLHDDADGLALTLPSWPKDAVLANQEEIDAIHSPLKPPEQIKAEIQAQIDSLEAALYMGRGEREAWLALTVSTAAQQGVTEPILYTKNPFYKKLKDQDNAIKLLRAQL